MADAQLTVYSEPVAAVDNIPPAPVTNLQALVAMDAGMQRWVNLESVCRRCAFFSSFRRWRGCAFWGCARLSSLQDRRKRK